MTGSFLLAGSSRLEQREKGVRRTNINTEIKSIVISVILDFSDGYSVRLTLLYIVMRLRLYSWLSTAPPESLAGGLLESDQILI